jgi:hypothetical protein
MKEENSCCPRLIGVFYKHGIVQKESTTVTIKKEQ